LTVTEKPRPYQPGTDNLHVYKILNTCVYYDETEHKAFGMLKVQTSEEGGNDDIWIKAIHLISTKPPLTSQGTRDDVWNSKPHITLLQEYIPMGYIVTGASFKVISPFIPVIPS
jgi:hypothetical protein